jgi:hypothetical protein
MPRGRHPQATTAAAVFLICTLLGLPFYEALSEETVGIITGDGVTTRTGPGVDFEKVGRLHTGDQATIVEEHDKWLKILDPQGREVWVFARWVEIVPPEPGMEEQPDPQPEPKPNDDEIKPTVAVQEASSVTPPPLIEEEGGHTPWIWIGAGAAAAGALGYFILAGEDEEPNTGSLHIRVEFP